MVCVARIVAECQNNALCGYGLMVLCNFNMQSDVVVYVIWKVFDNFAQKSDNL